MDAFYTAPLIIRTLTLVTVIESLAVHVGPLSAYLVIFHSSYIFKLPPDLWRLLSSFFLTGPNLGLILDPYMLFINGKQLETNTPRFARKGDFATYLAFVMITILILNATFFGGFIFLPALILAFCWTIAQENPDQQVTLFVFTMTNKWMPWAMLALTLVMGGPEAAWTQSTGIVAAHLFEFLTVLWPRYGAGRNFIITPAFVHAAFGDVQAGPKTREYGTSYAPANAGSRGSASSGGTGGAGGNASSSATTTGATRWGTMGPGRRLG